MGFVGLWEKAHTPRQRVKSAEWAAGRCHGVCAKGGMSPTNPIPSMPHHKLIAYQLALELVRLIASIRISDPRLREQARKSVASAALNAAEGAGRYSQGDKSRVFAIAAAEACEAVAAVEIAAALGACKPADAQAVLALGVRVKNVLSRLVR